MSRTTNTPNSRQAADSASLPTARPSIAEQLEQRLAGVGLAVSIKPPALKLRTGGLPEPPPRKPDTKLVEQAAIVVGLIAVAAIVLR